MLMDTNRTANLAALTPLRPALTLALAFAFVKLLLHCLTTAWSAHLGYGIFRDELYYIVCGQHLAWGYVDHAPMVALQARVASSLFGHELIGLRFFSALAGAARLFLTGMLAWALGGRRTAQALSMLGVLLAPQFLGIDSYLSMNSFEPVFWMAALLALVLLARGASTRWWLVFGLAGGLGLENKPSMLIFLLALLAALLLTPQRRLLRDRMCLLGIGLVVVLALPFLFWQLHNHWPMLEFLHNGKVENKNVILGPLAFLGQQIASYNPLSVLLWGAGLIWLLASARARSLRWIGLTYLLFLALMMASHAKDYYLSPIYPVLFAAGGCAWQELEPRRSTLWLIPAFALLLTVTGLLLLPMAIPVLRPAAWTAYTTHLHLRSSSTENQEQGPLPQFYADRFGWQDLANDVTHIYNSLSPEERAHAGILCSNYGEASAVNLLASPGAHLPFAISGHNNYYLWGPHGETGEVMIVINGASLTEMRQYYDEVEITGEMNNPYAMPYEHRQIFLARRRKGSIVTDWPSFKKYI